MKARSRARSSLFAACQAQSEHWGLAAKACLDGLAGAQGNVGLIYATERFAADLSSILTFLRETTHIDHWVGAVVPGILGAQGVERSLGGLSVMIGQLPAGAFQVLSGLDAASLRIQAGDWIARTGTCLGLVHGDPRHPGLNGLVQEAANDLGFLTGGLVAAVDPVSQLADNPVSGGLSGLLLGPEITAICGMTQGCRPIGTAHRVTRAQDGVVMELDGEPAIQVLKREAGQLLSRDLRRTAGYIHVGLPVEGSDQGAYAVRSLLGLDARQGCLVVSEPLSIGQSLMFVRRDANDAQLDMAVMVRDLLDRVRGRSVLAAHYVCSTARGRHMFGADAAEIRMILDTFGPIPLVGFLSNGEICGGQIHTHSGVLTLLVGGAS